MPDNVSLYSASYDLPLSAHAKFNAVFGPEYTKKMPTLVDLFGSFDLCDCKHCRSVLSPAAYFVDLLQLLNPPFSKKPLNVLLERRPDLEHIKLTCENTNTPMPYVDLVNEILESYVALGKISLVELGMGDTGDATAEELAANPQNTNADAYTKLRKAVYPLSMPYVQPLEVARAYLEHLGSSLHQVMETFQTAAGPTDLELACEYLKVSPEERDVVTGHNPAAPGAFYGLASSGLVAALEQVPGFLRQTGLSYLDLIELVKTRFINPGTPQPLTLDTPAEADPCDLTHTRIKNLDEAALHRMHRFIRLWRRLGWSMADLDKAMVALQATDIEVDFLSDLAVVRRIQAQGKTSLLELLSVWSDIDTYGEKSLYAKLFRNKAVQEIDQKFEPDVTGSILSDDSLTISQHVAALVMALRISAADLELIRADAELAEDDAKLNLANVSLLYRYPVVAKILKWRVKDVITLKALSGIDPFASPERTLTFVELARKVRQSGLSLAQLSYIYRHLPDPPANLAPQRQSLLVLAKSLRDGLTRIAEENTLAAGQEDPQGELTRTKLGMIFEPPIADQIIRMLDGTASYAAPLPSEPSDTFPDPLPNPLKSKIAYDKTATMLRFAGLMSESERDTLLGLPGGADYETAVWAIFRQPRTFIADTLLGILKPEDSQDPNDIANAISDLTVSGRFSYILERLLPYLRTTLSRSFVKQTVADALGVESAMAALLLEQLGAKASIDRFLDLATHGLSAHYFKNPDLPPIDLDPPGIAFDGTGSGAPPETQSARYTGLLLAPNNGTYTFSLSANAATARLFFGEASELVIKPPDTESAPLPLKAGELYDIRLELEGLSGPPTVELFWRSETISREHVASANLWPGHVVDAFESAFTLLHKIAMLVNAFTLTAKEVGYLQAHGGDPDGVPFDLRALPVVPAAPDAALFHRWERLHDLVSLRNSLPRGEVSLVDVFGAASLGAAANRLVDLTGWDRAELQTLITALEISALRNETGPMRLQRCFRTMNRLGASAQQLGGWARDVLKPLRAHNIAQDIKRTVKAKYDEEQWLAVARPLSDRLRESQRAALVDHVLADPTIVAQKITNSNQLFEYFLIDVNMSPCFMTSRIKQAISSVQLFVQRCLMNLERWVSPQEIDAEQWEWRKNYRVWEANRKVFLYPENWIEPELRDDKSPFFKELESQLLQSDVTEESAERAFLDYLEKLDGVARLEIVGLHVERGSGGVPKAIHVFGRTFNPPNVYYYRSLDLTTGVWTPWEKVTVDIQDDPEGVHLIPVAFNRRLYLFWPIFESKAKEISDPSAESEEHKEWENEVREWDKGYPENQKKLDAWQEKHNALQKLLDELKAMPPGSVIPEPTDVKDVGEAIKIMEQVIAEHDSHKPGPPGATPDYADGSAKVSRPYWEIKLAWSEYKGNKWLPKQVSPAALESKPTPLPLSSPPKQEEVIGDLPEKHEHVFKYLTYYSRLHVIVSRGGDSIGMFVLGECGGKVNAVGPYDIPYIYPHSGKAKGSGIWFESFKAEENTSAFKLDVGTVLAALPTVYTRYDMLYPSTVLSLPTPFYRDPFFLQDDRRTYLVMPTTETVIDVLTQSDKAVPELPHEEVGIHKFDPTIFEQDPLIQPFVGNSVLVSGLVAGSLRRMSHATR